MVWWEFLHDKDYLVVHRPMIDLSGDISAQDVGFYSDASGKETCGFGCVMGDSWLGGIWEPDYISQFKSSIEYLELFALCAGVFTWQRQLSNSRILVHCDNESVVHMINNQVSMCPRCMYLIC